LNLKTRKPTALKKQLLEKTKLKKRLFLFLKVAIAIFAIYLVVGSIDIQKTKEQILNANFWWLLLALIVFNLSKVLGAFRLNYFFKSLGLDLDRLYNLKLYYVGMLYNQFLPGGIGGDGYKVYLLNKQFKTPVKKLITATLLDRLSGGVALGFLMLIMAYFGTTQEVLGGFYWLLIPGILLAFPIYYVLVHYLFPTYKQYRNITSLQAIGVQGLQVVAAYLILLALGVDTGYVDYFTLFLVSSIAALLPISAPGGIGVREYVMAMGAPLLFLDQPSAVALTSLFYLISLFSAGIGVFFNSKFKTKNEDKADQ
jgi:glycosyltransferase 2 family protein